jgi:hypothetical protein
MRKVSHWYRPAAVVCLGASLLGCASTQLNFNTLDLASTIDSLIAHQVLYNLGRFQVDDSVIPAQVIIAGGTVTTSNSITPTVSAPLNVAETTTNMLAKVLGGATTTTTQLASARSNSSLSLAASDGWNQQWAIVPVADVDQIRKLRTLYQFAVGHYSRNELLCNYPINRKTGSASAGLASLKPAGAAKAGETIKANQSKNTLTYTGPDGSKIEATIGGDGGMNGSKRMYYIWCETSEKSLTIEDADEAFLSPPNCVVCSDQSPRYLEERENDECDNNLKKIRKDKKNAKLLCLHLNYRLKTGVARAADQQKDAWLHFAESIGDLPANALVIGQIGNRTAYALTLEQKENFAEFVLFTLEVVQQTSTSSTSAILVPPVVVQ